MVGVRVLAGIEAAHAIATRSPITLKERSPLGLPNSPNSYLCAVSAYRFSAVSDTCQPRDTIA
jgi:hypothetical protein